MKKGDVLVCPHCNMPGYTEVLIEKEKYIVTKHDVDWAIKVFKKVKEDICDEYYLGK